mmetsp:Transcript_37182/g.79324  ORF Transcript_37182/g.79324 Transcript_37182/m.79324 type:complete len:117 (-) Transcript_37182:106-456(-)
MPGGAPTNNKKHHYRLDPLPYTVVGLVGLVITSSAKSIHLALELFYVLFNAALCYIWSVQNNKTTLIAQSRMTMTAQVPHLIRAHILLTPNLDTSRVYWLSDINSDVRSSLGILLK